MHLLLPLLLSAPLQTGASTPTDPVFVEPPRARITLDLAAPGGATLETIQTMALDLIQLDLNGQRAVVLAPPADLAALDAAGVPYEIEVADEALRYAERLARTQTQVGTPNLGAWLNPPFGSGSMGGYYTLAQVTSVLDQIHAAYPTITTPKFSLGQSIQGRDIYAIKLSDNPDVDESEPEVRYDSLHHAREPQGMQTSFWFMLWCLENYGTDSLANYLIDEREMYFVMVVNPDGYLYNQQIAPNGGGLWRKNRRNNGGGSFGVDLNRNYPYQWGYDNQGSSPFSDSETYRGTSPASEPETQAMVAFIQAREFATSLSIHCFSNVWIQPYGYDFVTPTNQVEYDELNDLCTEFNGYPAGGPVATIGYPANGLTVDYEANLTGAFTWTPEIGSQSDGFWPSSDRIVPLAEDNLVAFQRVALAAGAFVYTDAFQLTEIGDGDGFVESGESVEIAVAVRNSGSDPTIGAVTATLLLDSPGGTVTAGQFDFGGLGSFDGANNLTSPLAFQVDANAEAGAAIGWRVVVAYEGFEQEFTGSVSIGEPRVLIADDIELQRGWIAGLPSDTANTGQWERGIPIGTSSSGQPANPGTDTTPGGQLAYVTGNGGGSGGNDDVDDGLTTLISPRMDLSGVSAARASYQRWFADLSTADDTFRIELSNDDGQSWATLEEISGNQNEWIESELDLQSVLPLTDAMRIRFVAEDDPNNSVVEAGVDDLAISAFGDGPLLALYGTPTVGGNVSLFTSVDVDGLLTVLVSAGTTQLTIPGVAGELLIDPASAFPLTDVSLSAGDATELLLAIPQSAVLGGTTLYLQGVSFDVNGFGFSNRIALPIE